MPNLKFLDHFSLDSLHFKSQTAEAQINQQQNVHYKKQLKQKNQLLTLTSNDLWSKIKSFLAVNSNQTTAEFPTMPNNNCGKFS